VVVLVPSLGAVAWAGLHGLQSGRDSANSLYTDHLLTLRDASALEIGLESAYTDGLELLATDDPTTGRGINADLFSSVAPEVDADIVSVGAESADDRAEHR
jgi:hypothetical protein